MPVTYCCHSRFRMNFLFSGHENLISVDVSFSRDIFYLVHLISKRKSKMMNVHIAIISEDQAKKDWLLRSLFSTSIRNSIFLLESLDAIPYLKSHVSENFVCLILGESYPYFYQMLHQALGYFPAHRIGILDRRLHGATLLLALKHRLYAYWTQTERFEIFYQKLFYFDHDHTGDGLHENSQYETSMNTETSRFLKTHGESLKKITNREMDLWIKIVEGQNTDSLVASMNLTKKSVRNLKARLMNRLNLHREVELILRGVEMGLYAYPKYYDEK